jgi:hypothetical protein
MAELCEMAYVSSRVATDVGIVTGSFITDVLLPCAQKTSKSSTFRRNSSVRALSAASNHIVRSFCVRFAMQLPNDTEVLLNPTSKRVHTAITRER